MVRASVLAELMATCGADERHAVAIELLEVASLAESPARWPWQKPVTPGATRALAAIAGAWDIWPDELRSVAAAIGRERWPRVLREAAESMSADERRGVARLVCEGIDQPICELAPRLLALADPTSASRLERAIVAGAFDAAGLDADTGERIMDEDAGARARLELVVAGACECFHEHQCRRVLLAAAALIEPRDLRAGDRGQGVSPVAKWFWSLDDRTREPLLSMIRSVKHPLVRVRAWEWSARSEMASACAERLARAATTPEHEGVLTRWHLSLNPRRLSAPALPTPAELAGLTRPARVGGARLAARSLASDEAGDLVAPLLADPDPGVRLAASLASPAPALADFAFDAEPAIASSSARRWSLAGLRGPRGGLLLRAVETDDGSRRRLVDRLTRSPVAPVRHVARGDLPAYDWAVDSSPLARLAARHMLARDPDGATRRLLAELESPDERRRLGAIGVVRALRLHAAFAGRLVAMVREAGTEGGLTRRRATAVAALGDQPTAAPEASGVIEECLHDADARVRANAVEAMARRVRFGSAHDDHALLTLLELKDDSAHRARANALRGLLESAAGAPSVESVRSMLADDRPMHRLAGVWLAGRVLPGVRSVLAARYDELAGAVRRAADDDKDHRVRRRAAHAARLMTGVVA